MATLRPKDGESPEKAPRDTEAAREDLARQDMRHGHDAVPAISGAAAPRASKAR